MNQRVSNNATKINTCCTLLRILYKHLAVLPENLLTVKFMLLLLKLLGVSIFAPIKPLVSLQYLFHCCSSNYTWYLNIPLRLRFAIVILLIILNWIFDNLSFFVVFRVKLLYMISSLTWWSFNHLHCWWFLFIYDIFIISHFAFSLGNIYQGSIFLV